MHSPVTASIIAQMAVSDRGGTTRRREPNKRTRRTAHRGSRRSTDRIGLFGGAAEGAAPPMAVWRQSSRPANRSVSQPNSSRSDPDSPDTRM